MFYNLRCTVRKIDPRSEYADVDVTGSGDTPSDYCASIYLYVMILYKYNAYDTRVTNAIVYGEG